MEVAIFERMLNLAVDVEEGKACSERQLTELYTLIACLKEQLEGSAALLIARLITLFTYPGNSIQVIRVVCSFMVLVCSLCQ